MNKFKWAWMGLAVVFVIIIAMAVRNTHAESDALVDDTKEMSDEQPQLYLSIPSDTLKLHHHTIASGESFSVLLSQRGFSSAEIFSIAAAVKDSFDIRRIRAGVRAEFLQGPHAQRPSHFIYPQSAFTYWIIPLHDSAQVRRVEKHKTYKAKTISGVIDDALTTSISRAGGTNALAMELVGIYAWSIDFFRLQQGDQFQVIYENAYVDDTTYVGLGRILAANIVHSGHNYFAFPYENKLGFNDFFDEEGRSLRKTFLRAPLEFSRISSRYSNNRLHPVTGVRKAHLGTDYAAPKGTPIMTTADGEVIAATYTSANGNYVKVRHNSTYTTQYLHMSKIQSGIKPGVHVRQGDVIGYVGSTGLATGPHVCYRFWVNGKQVDPYAQKLPEAEPLPEEEMAAFKKHIAPKLEALRALAIGEQRMSQG